jgi:hypothetical protein
MQDVLIRIIIGGIFINFVHLLQILRLAYLQ